jgi:hypothetical protein
MNLHLSHEQLCDLLFSDLSMDPEHDCDVVHEHLRACLICSAELESLRSSLSLFRDTSTSYARQELAQRPLRRASIAPPHTWLHQPLYWAAAVLVIVAALFPLSMHRQDRALPAAEKIAQSTAVSAESDDALLADIDQKLSADVPAPLEPLAATTSETLTSYPSDQRKN